MARRYKLLARTCRFTPGTMRRASCRTLTLMHFGPGGWRRFVRSTLTFQTHSRATGWTCSSSASQSMLHFEFGFVCCTQAAVQSAGQCRAPTPPSTWNDRHAATQVITLFGRFVLAMLLYTWWAYLTSQTKESGVV